MSRGTIVYTFKKKADRLNLEKYRELVKLINRQAGQGADLEVLGMYEAKKAFRCESYDMYSAGFRIAKGEYVLLVNGDIQDANHWRLHRACRNDEESHNAWPQTGCPDDERVYASGDSEETAFLKNLHVDFPEYEDEVLPEGEASENYVIAYEIKEATKCNREDAWCMLKLTEADFAEEQALQAMFKDLVQCNSAEKISKIPNISKLAEYIIRQDEIQRGQGRETSPHFSLVIAVIDGTNNHWKSGIWCYKRQAGAPMEIHPVDYFMPDGYEIADDKLIPSFE